MFSAMGRMKKTVLMVLVVTNLVLTKRANIKNIMKKMLMVLVATNVVLTKRAIGCKTA